MRNRIQELTDYLIQKLQALEVEIISPVSKAEERSAIVVFSIGEKNRELYKKLAQRNIFVAIRDGNIRLSVNIFNNSQDIDTLFESIEEFKAHN